MSHDDAEQTNRTDGWTRGRGKTHGAKRKTGAMIRTGIVLAAAFGLAACGGGQRVDRFDTAPRVSFATGPISSACNASGRKAANARLCGCIQAVADTRLDRSDQRLAARFFNDPHQAQEVRMSDRSDHDAFWDRYRAFADSAEQSCRSL